MRLIAIALSMLFPVQVMALSCVPASVERSYAYAQDSKDPYVVLRGTLTFDERKLPKTDRADPNNRPKLTNIPAKFSGQSLSMSGFETPFQKAVTLEIRCFAAWCGSARSGDSVLAFVKRTDAGYALSIDPCYSTVFSDPTPKMLEAVTACMNGADCR